MTKKANKNIYDGFAGDKEYELMIHSPKKETNRYNLTSAMTYVKNGIMTGINLTCVCVERDMERYTFRCVASDGCDFVFNMFSNAIGENNRKLKIKLNILSVADNIKDYVKNKDKQPNWMNITGKKFFACFGINDNGYLVLNDISKVKENDGLEDLKRREEEEVAQELFA